MTETSRNGGTCGPCEREDPVARIAAGVRRKRRAQLRAAAKMPKRRKTVKLQLSHNGNTADLYHVVIPKYLIETLGWVKGTRLRVAIDGGKVIYEPAGM